LLYPFRYAEQTAETPFKTAIRTVSEIEDVVVIVEIDTGHPCLRVVGYV